MLDNLKKADILQFPAMNYKLKQYQLKEITNQIWALYSDKQSRKFSFLFFMYLSVKWSCRSRENLEAFVWKTKRKISRFSANRLTLLAS